MADSTGIAALAGDPIDTAKDSKPMNKHLKRLIKLMDPLEPVPYGDVDWNKLEDAVGLKYPNDFKEFLGVYGGSVWCNRAAPFYTPAKTDKEIKGFLSRSSQSWLRWQGICTAKDGKRIQCRFVRTKAGCFPS